MLVIKNSNLGTIIRNISTFSWANRANFVT